MSDNVAPQVPTLVVGETNNFSVSFAAILDSGELLTGTPTVEEETTADLVISNESVNDAALTVNGASVAIGKAVQFTVSGQLVASSPYVLKITVSTDATPAQTKIRHVTFNVEAA